MLLICTASRTCDTANRLYNVTISHQRVLAPCRLPSAAHTYACECHVQAVGDWMRQVYDARTIRQHGRSQASAAQLNGSHWQLMHLAMDAPPMQVSLQKCMQQAFRQRSCFPRQHLASLILGVTLTCYQPSQHFHLIYGNIWQHSWAWLQDHVTFWQSCSSCGMSCLLAAHPCPTGLTWLQRN